MKTLAAVYRFIILAVVGMNVTIVSASAFQLQDKVQQGSLIRGTATPGETIMLGDVKLGIGSNGVFVFGIAHDATGNITLDSSAADGTPSYLSFPIEARTWSIETIDHLPEAQVTPDAETLERIRRDQATIKTARHRLDLSRDFTGNFMIPAQGRLSGQYGSQRILNGEPHAPHLGLDIAAPLGTTIVAPAAGRVLMVEPDLYLTGATIMIDHGLGVTSLIAHLSLISISAGAEVVAGQEIGKVGMTGRATGPNAHWGVYWFDTAIDPALLITSTINAIQKGQ